MATFRRGKSKPWRARVAWDYMEFHLGYFATREEAEEAERRCRVQNGKKTRQPRVPLHERRLLWCEKQVGREIKCGETWARVVDYQIDDDSLGVTFIVRDYVGEFKWHRIFPARYLPR